MYTNEQRENLVKNNDFLCGKKQENNTLINNDDSLKLIH